MSTPARAVPDARERSCRSAAELVLPGCDWIHRRVQSIAYVEPELVKVRLSIDFTIPDGCECSHVPLSVLPKWPPLYRFDYLDAAGVSIPLLTSTENGAADWALMQALTEHASPTLMSDLEYVTALRKLSMGPDTDLVDIFEELFERVSAAYPDSGELNPTVERLIDLAAALTDSTLLWFPCDRSTGQRMVAKLSYMLPAVSVAPLYQRVLRSLSWNQPSESLPLRHIGADASYHAELEAPPVLVIRDLNPKYFWFTGDPKRAAQDHAESTAAAEAAGLRPEQHLDYRGRFAHVYISGRRPMGANLFYRFAPARSGFIAAALISSALVAIFVTLLYLRRGVLSHPEDLDGVVALLLLVPALIGYFVFRPSDPPLVRRYLLGVQALVMLSALVPLVMAGFLLIYRDSGHKIHSTWHCSVILAWVLVALLAFSFARAGTRARPEHE